MQAPARARAPVMEAISPTVNPVANFRQNVGMSSLRYGAAYYPWVQTIYRPRVNFRQLALFPPPPGAVPIPPNTIDTLTGDAAIDSLVLLRVESIEAAPELARALADAVEAMRANRDATGLLSRARRVAEGGVRGSNGIGAWSGVW